MNHTKQPEYFLLIELYVIRRLIFVPVLVLCPGLLLFDYDERTIWSRLPA
jgi:hypothetical protein